MDHKAFEAAYHVMRCEKCCGNCRHFRREYEDSACEHPKCKDYPAYPGEFDDTEPGLYSGGDYCVDEGFVCDLWERKAE